MRSAKFKIFLSTFCVTMAASCVDAQSPAGEGASTPATTSAPVDPANLRTFVELARADLRMIKAVIVAENMTLSDDEASEFWPLQREYEYELTRLLDQRFALVQKFLPSAAALTDAQATELAKTAFDIEAQRTALKRTYFAKFCEVIPAAKAARFFQIENQLNAAIELKVAAQMPLIK